MRGSERLNPTVVPATDGGGSVRIVDHKRINCRRRRSPALVMVVAALCGHRVVCSPAAGAGTQQRRSGRAATTRFSAGGSVPPSVRKLTRNPTDREVALACARPSTPGAASAWSAVATPVGPRVAPARRSRCVVHRCGECVRRGRRRTCRRTPLSAPVIPLNSAAMSSTSPQLLPPIRCWAGGTPPLFSPRADPRYAATARRGSANR